MLRRCFVNIYQRPLRSLLVFLLFCLLTAFVVFGMMTYDAAVILRKDTLKQIGASIAISGNSEYDNSLREIRKKLGSSYNDDDFFPPLSTEALNTILEIDGVLGIGQTYALLDALPVNFKNSKAYQGVNPNTQVTQGSFNDADTLLFSESVNIIGDNSIEHYEDFRRNLSFLVDGAYPSTENPGLLISSVLAEENSLSVGDVLEFKVIARDYEAWEKGGDASVDISEQVEAVKIVGIFSTHMYFNICETNEDGIGIYRLSPFNTIFADFTTGKQLKQESNDIRFFSIFLSSPEKIASTLIKLQEAPIDWDKYNAYDTQVFHQDEIKETEKFLTSTLLILIISIVVGIAIFAIVINSFSDAEEISVLLLIGERKSRIVKGKLFEYAIFALLSLPIGVLVGYQVARLMQTALTPTISFAGNITSSFTTGALNYIPELSVALTPYNILLAIIYVLLLLLIVLIITIYRTYKLNNKNGFVKPE